MRQEQTDHRDHLGQSVLLGAVELLVLVALMAWMVLTVLTALLAHAVLLALPGHRASQSSARRVQRARQWSGHRDLLVNPWPVPREPWGPRDRKAIPVQPARRGSTSKR